MESKNLFIENIKKLGFVEDSDPNSAFQTFRKQIEDKQICVMRDSKDKEFHTYIISGVYDLPISENTDTVFLIKLIDVIEYGNKLK